MRIMLNGKIHRATVTGADLAYEGSITIDPETLEAVNMLEYEQVHVLNVNNGNRFVTYIIKGVPGANEIRINGAAARLCEVGDKVIICSYAELEEEAARKHQPTVVWVDEGNRIVRRSPA
ncbi:MAG TPA: aspartate 1-decarboxylase [Candidatus Sumerlaeota bacterium]|nr:aspartate 1-decarboxylase [Candidatus Sumerlaeota bacterium]HPS02934.1 aspartate 1-decarboxylase [Candidatus Sumerlaeota bacterium]